VYLKLRRLVQSYLCVTALKLECRFSDARSAAFYALFRDCKSVKARYRRAMACKGMGDLPECLIDLYTLLALEPTNADARGAFEETLTLYDVAGKQTVDVPTAVECGSPPAHGAMSAASRSPLITDDAPSLQHPHGGITAPERRQAPLQVTRACSGCSARKARQDVKSCAQVRPLLGFAQLHRLSATQCKTAAYCSKACQRADW
jgi:hypothetical protein